MFPSTVKFSQHLNLEILGTPIGDYLFCSKFITEMCADAKKCLSEVAAIDPHSLVSPTFVWQLLQIGPPGKGHPTKSGRFFKAV